MHGAYLNLYPVKEGEIKRCLYTPAEDRYLGRGEMPFCAGGMGCVKQPGTWVCSAGLMAKGIHPNLLSLALDVMKVNASEGKYSLNARSFC